MSEIKINNLTKIVTSGGSFILAPLVFASGVDALPYENATSAASTDVIKITYTVPQSPMGKELRDILFADAEFKKYYDEFSKELDEDLDNQYKDGKINPMKYYRMKSGITQSRLANIIGESQSHISRWESKRSLNTISSKNLFAIAKALNISMEELLNDHSS